MNDEDFLKRWSRRKQEAKNPERAALERAAPERDTSEQAAPVPVGVPQPDQVDGDGAPAIDLAKLPSLDSISASTDITDFLRDGIPAELSRAALRRAWASDPTIRDFVGLSENAWDFTDPDAIPGFGALRSTPEQISAMVERVTRGAQKTSEKLLAERSAEELQPENPKAERVGASAADAPQAPLADASTREADEKTAVAAQPDPAGEDGDAAPVQRRGHGGALPF